jgi:hypothetical protein
VNGPLVDAASVPDWLRRLVEGTSDLGAAAFTLLRPSRTLRPSPRMRTRAASVLILFGEGGRGPDVLLLRRADTLGSHAGQVAFPGGGAEDHDESPVATALREAGTNWTGPAFAVDGLFIWGFTAGLLSALLTVAGWEREWDSADVRDLAGWEKR